MLVKVATGDQMGSNGLTPNMQKVSSAYSYMENDEIVPIVLMWRGDVRLRSSSV